MAPQPRGDFGNKLFRVLNTRKGNCETKKQNSVLALQPLPSPRKASWCPDRTVRVECRRSPPALVGAALPAILLGSRAGRGLGIWGRGGTLSVTRSGMLWLQLTPSRFAQFPSEHETGGKKPKRPSLISNRTTSHRQPTSAAVVLSARAWELGAWQAYRAQRPPHGPPGRCTGAHAGHRTTGA